MIERARRVFALKINPKVPAYLFMLLGVVAFAFVIYTARASSEDGATITGQDMGQAFAAFAAVAVAGWAITQASIANQQAQSSTDQAKALREQIHIQQAEIAAAGAESERAAAEADFQRSHAERTLRATIKQRLDAQAPRVVVSLTAPTEPAFEWRQSVLPYGHDSMSDRTENWQRTAPEQIDTTKVHGNIEVRLRVGICFQSFNDVPAVIDCVEPAEGQLIGLQREHVLLPGTAVSVTWTRTMSATGHHSNADAQSGRYVVPWRPRFWVRDLARNVIDEFQFTANIEIMQRNGTYLTLLPETAWGASYAEQSPRKYAYFDRPEGKREVGEELTAE